MVFESKAHLRRSSLLVNLTLTLKSMDLEIVAPLELSAVRMLRITKARMLNQFREE
jgi:hypothetical protein